MLSGLILWAVHFFALYAIASIFLTTPLARALTLLLTSICIAFGALMFVRTLRGSAPTVLDAWIRAIALGGLGIAGVAMVWQSLPALFV
jgi:hypothetical protein